MILTFFEKLQSAAQIHSASDRGARLAAGRNSRKSKNSYKFEYRNNFYHQGKMAQTDFFKQKTID